MSKQHNIHYPPWNTKAVVIEREYISSDFGITTEWILFSYNTWICTFIEDEYSHQLKFNTEQYQHSSTTSKHFKWFMNSFMTRSMKQNCLQCIGSGSIANFLGAYSRMEIPHRNLNNPC